MNDPVKRHKSCKFNKVDNNTFKNAKKLSINKYLQDRKLLTESFTPIKSRKGRTKSNRNLTNNFFFKKNSDINNQNFSIANKTMKKYLSNSKINTFKSKDMILLKKQSVPINIKGKNEKNEEEKQDLTKYFIPEPINKRYKRYISSNNINHVFKSMINNNNDLDLKVNSLKKSKLHEKEHFNGLKKNSSKPKSKKKDKDKENVKDNGNIKDKENKLGKEYKELKDHKLKKNEVENKENKLGKDHKGKKSNKLKIINKEKKENNEDIITQKKYETLEKKEQKFKFFCCL